MVSELLSLDGRTVVVAGAGGGGIGTAICRVIAEAGGTVAALDVDETRLALAEQAMDTVGGTYRSWVTDVRSPEGVRDVVNEIADAGGLYGLVHVAGGFFNQWEPLVTTPSEAWDNVVRLNLNSTFLTTRTVGRRLVEQGTGGSIVHITSVSGLTAMPFGAAYASAKAGVVALTRTAALELGPAGIRVNAVAPGTVRTPRSAERGTTAEDTPEEKAAVPLQRRGAPSDIAHAVLFLLSDLAGWVTGQVLAVDGGSSARPSFLGADNLPVFVHDEGLRDRLLG
jgi:NAD(P)-dependent dehydrogenase (short-subunit alcohol dehydrogenase family)